MKEIKSIYKVNNIKGFFFELEDNEIIQIQRVGKYYYIELSKNNSILYNEEIELKELRITLLWLLSLRLQLATFFYTQALKIKIIFYYL